MFHRSMSTRCLQPWAVLCPALFVLASAGTASAVVIQTNTNANVAASNSDLLQTSLSSSSFTGSWFGDSRGGTSQLPVLYDGAAAYATAGQGSSNYAAQPNPNIVVPNNGATVTYTLDTTTNPLGYDLTQIDLFHGWRDNGRDGMRFDIDVALVGSPATFIDLYETAKYDPPSDYGRQRITDDAGTLATGVAQVRFRVFSIDGGGGQFYGGLSEIDIIGTAVQPAAPAGEVVPEPATAMLGTLGALGLLMRRRRHS